MEAKNFKVFGPFRLDERSELLWNGGQQCALRPKTFAMLRYLVAHPGDLIGKEEEQDERVK